MLDRYISLRPGCIRAIVQLADSWKDTIESRLGARVEISLMGPGTALVGPDYLLLLMNPGQERLQYRIVRQKEQQCSTCFHLCL